MTNAEKQLKEMEEQMRREQASQKQEKQGRSAKPYAVKKESHPLASFLIGLVLKHPEKDIQVNIKPAM